MKITLGDQVVEGEAMQFTAIEDPWILYKVSDGTVLKLKVVVSDIIKLPGTDPITGFPQYMIRSSNILAVEPTTPKGEQH